LEFLTAIANLQFSTTGDAIITVVFDGESAGLLLLGVDLFSLPFFILALLALFHYQSLNIQ
jgi:hypothetical protein